MATQRSQPLIYTKKGHVSRTRANPLRLARPWPSIRICASLVLLLRRMFRHPVGSCVSQRRLLRDVITRQGRGEHRAPHRRRRVHRQRRATHSTSTSHRHRVHWALVQVQGDHGGRGPWLNACRSATILRDENQAGPDGVTNRQPVVDALPAPHMPLVSLCAGAGAAADNTPGRQTLATFSLVWALLQ